MINRALPGIGFTLIMMSVQAQDFAAPGTLSGYQGGAALSTVPSMSKPQESAEDASEYHFPQEQHLRKPVNPWSESGGKADPPMPSPYSSSPTQDNPWQLDSPSSYSSQNAPRSTWSTQGAEPTGTPYSDRAAGHHAYPPSQDYGTWGYNPAPSQASGNYQNQQNQNLNTYRPNQSYYPEYDGYSGYGFPDGSYQEVTPGLYGPMDPGMMPGSGSINFPFNPWGWF